MQRCDDSCDEMQGCDDIHVVAAVKCRDAMIAAQGCDDIHVVAAVKCRDTMIVVTCRDAMKQMQ